VSERFDVQQAEMLLNCSCRLGSRDSPRRLSFPLTSPPFDPVHPLISGVEDLDAADAL
jgi:hypothetical protein